MQRCLFVLPPLLISDSARPPREALHISSLFVRWMHSSSLHTPCVPLLDFWEIDLFSLFQLQFLPWVQICQCHNNDHYPTIDGFSGNTCFHWYYIRHLLKEYIISGSKHRRRRSLFCSLWQKHYKTFFFYFPKMFLWKLWNFFFCSEAETLLFLFMFSCLITFNYICRSY